MKNSSIINHKSTIVENYRRLGFPIEVSDTPKSRNAILAYPGYGAGFFVIDVDPRAGGWHSLKQLEKAIGPLPKTVMAKSQSGGLHMYFRYPEGIEIDSKVELLPGIDILSEDARITLPPTQGTFGRYEWLRDPFTQNMAMPPHSLLQIINHHS